MQRRFNFRLGRVLRVRAIEERVARAEWGTAQAELRQAEAKRDDRSLGLASSRQDMGQGRASGSIGADRALLVERALDAQMFGLENAIEQVYGKLIEADRLGAAWRKREQDRKALVELEERARTSHRIELEATENAEMDEQAIGRVTRTRQSKREFHS